MNASAHPRGKYIVLEGIESVGKTTHRDRLAERLHAEGVHVRIIREPAGDAVGQAIRKILLDPQYEIDTTTEVFLLNAARASLMRHLEQWLEAGVWVVCSRNYLSTIAYQGYGRADSGLAVDEIRRLGDLATTVTADLQILLDAPVAVTTLRPKRRAPGHRFDSLSPDFLTRARDGYVDEAKRRGLPVIDATPPVDEVAQAIWSLVKPLLTKK